MPAPRPASRRSRTNCCSRACRIRAIVASAVGERSQIRQAPRAQHIPLARPSRSRLRRGAMVCTGPGPMKSHRFGASTPPPCTSFVRSDPTPRRQSLLLPSAKQPLNMDTASWHAACIYTTRGLRNEFPTSSSLTAAFGRLCFGVLQAGTVVCLAPSEAPADHRSPGASASPRRCANRKTENPSPS